MSKVQHDSETPAHGQQVISAVAFIYRYLDGQVQVFLPRRAKTKKFLPDVFEMPGGHIDFGEDIEQGLIREVKEEFNMTIAVGDAFAAFTYLNEVKGSHSVEVAFFAEFVDPVINIQLDPEDHSEYVWASLEDLPRLFSGPKGMDDIEAQKIVRGFELLSAETNPFVKLPE